MKHVAKSRIGKLRTIMKHENTNAYYARHTADIRWLTGFDGVFDSEQAHALLVAYDKVFLHTDSRYSRVCEQAAEEQDESIIIDSSSTSHEEFVSHHGIFGQISIEHDLPLNEYRNITDVLRATAFIETENVILRLRSVKDEEELARLRKAQQIADGAFEKTIEYIRKDPHVTERQVALFLESAMLNGGAEGISFSSIVATGAHGANPHAIPTDTPLDEGCSVVIDFGCIYQGYCSDTTRTVFIGKPTPQIARAYEAIRAANEEVEKVMRPGVTGADMHNLAEKVLADYGFGGCMGHSLGHGVGLAEHELPNLSSRYLKPLQEGNVVTVEPGIYLGEGHKVLEENQAPFGMRLEDCGVLTADGYTKFSTIDHSAVIIERL